MSERSLVPFDVGYLQKKIGKIASQRCFASPVGSGQHYNVEKQHRAIRNTPNHADKFRWQNQLANPIMDAKR